MKPSVAKGLLDHIFDLSKFKDTANLSHYITFSLEF
jgi:hypothetical protein